MFNSHEGQALIFFQCVIQGLDDEYQEEGKLLGQYTYQEDGEALQMFQVMVTEEAFQALFLLWTV